MIASIVQVIDPRPGQNMVEIGPGLAALTKPLVACLGHLVVIELDRDLAAHLRRNPQLTVIESDVLAVDFKNLTSRKTTPEKVRVVGNLPYNISTPILFHLLEAVDAIADQHFMLQKEVVDRMVAGPCSSNYGRLSVMLQWRYAMTNLLSVAPESFDPPPRVQSAIVRMVPHALPALVDVALLSQVVRIAFSQRRKILRHTLGQWLQEQRFGGQFDIQRRAEEVSVEEYIALVQSLSKDATGPGNNIQADRPDEF